ncbi:MAG: YitT family protein [Candidatus Izemoplasmatales bacterium]|nr:YitT family protein [Candidatus Izemoplasmatales bacterium]
MSKTRIYHEIRTLLAVFIFTFIYGIGVVWFLEAAIEPLYTGGIPGIGQLIRSIVLKYSNYDLGNIFLGAFVLLMNIPTMILGFIGVSKRFTIYSFISVLIQATMLGFIPRIDFQITDTFTLAVLGGLLTGIGIGGSLRFGTSTGGLDIIAQYLSLRKGMSVGYVSLLLNVLIALIGGFVYGSGAIVAYTVIRIIVTTLVTDKIHTSYNFLKVEIITKVPEKMYDEILVKLYRGVTILKAEGAYSHDEKSFLVVVISAYELRNLKSLLKENDPKAFTIITPVKDIYGNFKRKTIV